MESFVNAKQMTLRCRRWIRDRAYNRKQTLKTNSAIATNRIALGDSARFITALPSTFQNDFQATLNILHLP